MLGLVYGKIVCYGNPSLCIIAEHTHEGHDMAIWIIRAVFVSAAFAQVVQGQVSINDLYQISGRLLERYAQNRQLPMPVEISIIAHGQRSMGRAAIYTEQVWTPWGPKAVFHIFVNPARVMDTSANTWVFWMGHELGHPLIPALGGSPQAEFACDEFGASLATAIGANLDGYFNEYTRRSEIYACSMTHGCEVDRLKNIAIKMGRQDLFNRIPNRHPGRGMPGPWPH